MKKYEEITYLKGEIKRVGSYYERRINQIANTTKAMKDRQILHDLEMQEYKKSLEFLENDKAEFFNLLQQWEARLKKLETKPKPKPKVVKPVPEKKPSPDPKKLKELEELKKKEEELKKELGVVDEPKEETTAEKIDEILEEAEEKIVGVITGEPIIDEDKIQEKQIEIVEEHKKNVNGQLDELKSGKVQCPECGSFFTKGGAFASHYKSHFNGD